MSRKVGEVKDPTRSVWLGLKTSGMIHGPWYDSRRVRSSVVTQEWGYQSLVTIVRVLCLLL